AGLVYSICLNYANRVKGSRPVGERVFMQGGVCYNSAVPLAMASVCGKSIVVPPEPGLMGAFGVALEVKKRLAAGLLQEKEFDLPSLAGREVEYGKAFTCPGGPEKCDRKCAIEMVRMNGEKHPFGGACNRYDNLRRGKTVQATDLIRDRHSLMFGNAPTANQGPRVGINRSFLTHSYFPLYSAFFTSLGVTPVLPETCTREGMDRRNAPFCHPGELAHGYFHSLLNLPDPPDFLFLPQFRALPDLNGQGASQTCPFAQGEPYFLRAAFADELAGLKSRGTVLLNPVLDLTHGLAAAWAPLWQCARAMGFSESEAREAFDRAREAQRSFEARCREWGSGFLQDLEADPDRMGVVIFGRSYNAFAPEAHKGIPAKLASRGVPVIPFDFLDFDPEEPFVHMYWGMGQRILKAARLTAGHPQLFGLFVTNFSCGPDSFLLTYFRGIMGRKPSLTLELDSHTADAGIETRIEAFLDVVSAYRKLPAASAPAGKTPFIPARTDFSGPEPRMTLSSGEVLPISDPRVNVLLPSMGRLSSETLAAVFTSAGYHVQAHPPADEAVLKIGRANTSCKECLPLILTTGMLLNLVAKREPGQALVYFLPTASGPCRFGQYRIFMEGLVRRLEIPDLAFWSPTSEDTYGNLSGEVRRAIWRAVIVSDTLEDARSMLLANARDTAGAMEVFEREWQRIIHRLSTPDQPGFLDQISETASVLASIPLKRPVSEVPLVSLVGEIFVRRDGLSRQWITERLAAQGMAVACAPVAEWIFYVRYDMERQLAEAGLSRAEVAAVSSALGFMEEDERTIKDLVARSGLVDGHPVDLTRIVEAARPHVPPDLGGEAILTVGSALCEVGERTCGAIAMGPFGCMPNRLSEAILSTAMNHGGRRPFLAVESDGSPFPQLLNARLEAFCLGAMRLHEEMRRQGGAKSPAVSLPYPPRMKRNAQQGPPSEMNVDRSSRVPAGK
ncbi:MAG: acyl-CoA dehydratase activase-related protein, partial [Pseudomonadota bacterium]